MRTGCRRLLLSIPDLRASEDGYADESSYDELLASMLEPELTVIYGAGVGIEDISVDELLALSSDVSHKDKSQDWLVPSLIGARCADAGFVPCGKALLNLCEKSTAALVDAHWASGLAGLVSMAFHSPKGDPTSSARAVDPNTQSKREPPTAGNRLRVFMIVPPGRLG